MGAYTSSMVRWQSMGARFVGAAGIGGLGVTTLTYQPVPDVGGSAHVATVARQRRDTRVPP